jgi:opacity protein-like surface antigen
MRTVRIRFIVMALVLALPTYAFAQARARRSPVPDGGMVAFGGEAGFLVPSEEALDTSLVLGGFFEYYFTPRLSFRPGVTYVDSSFDRENEDSLRDTRIGLDVIYNWEGGRWHPFAGGGLGIHSLRLKDNGQAIGDTSTELGLGLLGGIEYFFNRNATLKMEGRALFVEDTFGLETGGFAATFGVKWYF